MTDKKFVFSKFREKRYELDSMNNDYANYKINANSDDNTFHIFSFDRLQKNYEIQNPYYKDNISNYYMLNEIPNIFDNTTFRKYPNYKYNLQFDLPNNYEVPINKYPGYKYNIGSPFI